MTSKSSKNTLLASIAATAKHRVEPALPKAPDASAKLENGAAQAADGSSDVAEVKPAERGGKEAQQQAARTERVAVLLTADEKRHLKKRAVDLNTDMSSLVVQTLIKAGHLPH